MSYTYFRCFALDLFKSRPHQAIDIIFAGYEGDWHDKDDTFELLGGWKPPRTKRTKQLWCARRWLMLIDFQYS